MNIFYLSNSPKECAQMHVDKHVVKMILEYAQLLSTAHRVLDDVDADSIFYKATHVNHPSAVWVRKSFRSYCWLYLLLEKLCKEYTHRYGKIHKVESSGLLSELLEPPLNIPDGDFTTPTPAMPEEYIVHGDCIQSYQNYYNGAKHNLFSWKNRAVPNFITGEL
jgi:hypothetical protein